MTDAVFNWFWQPPIEGKPGLCMITDEHPGPDHPGVPFVVESLQDTLAHVEARIPPDVHLFQLRIYARDVFKRWREVRIDAESRRYKVREPAFSQGDLCLLWDSREVGEDPVAQ